MKEKPKLFTHGYDRSSLLERIEDPETAKEFFAKPQFLQGVLKKNKIWDEKWHDDLVQKLCEDVKAGERTFETNKQTGEFISLIKVVSGGLAYETHGGQKGIVRAKKEIIYKDKDGNVIKDRAQQFYEKDDRIVGGKIRTGDSVDSTFMREAEEELPVELYTLLSLQNVKIGDVLSTESISPGYPNLKTVYEVYPVHTILELPESFDTSKVFNQQEEKKLPNGETKITNIEYTFVFE